MFKRKTIFTVFCVIFIQKSRPRPQEKSPETVGQFSLNSFIAEQIFAWFRGYQSCERYAAHSLSNCSTPFLQVAQQFGFPWQHPALEPVQDPTKQQTI
jgi:hypothetical protein